MSLEPNQKFGLLTVLSIITPINGHKMCIVECSCGKQKPCRQSTLLSEGASSCGCERVRKAKKALTTHGLSGGWRGKRPGIYSSWDGIIQRCLNSNYKQFKDYGGRGITVCDRWAGSFQSFFEDMGADWFVGATIERKNNNGNYEPDNCQWATRAEQNKNTRRTVVASDRAAIAKRMRSQGCVLREIAEAIGISIAGVHYLLSIRN